MELRIPVQELAGALSMMQGVVQRKNTMAILANVLIDVATDENGAGIVTISATDLDVGIRTTRPCEALEAGTITVPARALADMVKVLPGPDVSLKRLPNNHVEVKSGRTKARLNALSPEEFPTLPDYDDVQFVKLNLELFSDMVEKTVYAASTDETRYNLNGVLFDPGGDERNELTMVATDGHRLVRMERTFEDTRFPDDMGAVILPRKGLGEARRLLDADDEGGGVEIGFHQNHAVIRRGSTVVGMRLVEGTFPDYKQVIPKMCDKVVRITRQDLVGALRRVIVLASDKMQPVKLVLKDDSLEVSCSNPDTGEINDDVAVEYSGDSVKIAFNGRYLLEALSSLSDQNIVLKLIDQLSPGVVVGVDQTHHLCVVMPMRL
ncbi:MAG: DNA polymerase III subunit beta [Deltaproteobacteria bacterium]|nr:DNA polymerase III subunit beta [Deltaproteobacteria bacterium]